MTTEDDFHAMLDANPDDWQTRLIFADWLEDRGDKRAEGYRALGVLRKNGCNSVMRSGVRVWDAKLYSLWFSDGYEYVSDFERLPVDWFSLLDNNWNASWSNTYENRRAAEDAAALAFAKLPAGRRAELLSSTLTAAPP